jgi:hypothetical protein
MDERLSYYAHGKLVLFLLCTHILRSTEPTVYEKSHAREHESDPTLTIFEAEMTAVVLVRQLLVKLSAITIVSVLSAALLDNKRRKHD